MCWPDYAETRRIGRLFVRDGWPFSPGTFVGFMIDPFVGSRPTKSGGTTALSSWKIASATSAFA
jgi:hypothetical protein